MVKDKGLRYILVASLCSVFGIITMLLGMKTVREKDYIQQSKKNPVEGFADILKTSIHGRLSSLRSF